MSIILRGLNTVGIYTTPIEPISERRSLVWTRRTPYCVSIIRRPFLLPPCNLSLDELRHAVV
jgi:hypothetical protein